jgi:hypothetical protein
MKIFLLTEPYVLYAVAIFSAVTASEVLAFATPIALIALGVMQQFQAAKARAAEKASAEARDAAKAMAVSAAEAAETNRKQTDKIHTLVNSNFESQLRISSMALRRVADLTKGKPGGEIDEKIAVEAEKLLRDHVTKQAIVDNMPK